MINKKGTTKKITGSLFLHTQTRVDKHWFLLIVFWFLLLVGLFIFEYTQYQIRIEEMALEEVSLRDVARVEGWDGLDGIVDYATTYFAHPLPIQQIVVKDPHKTFVTTVAGGDAGESVSPLSSQ